MAVPFNSCVACGHCHWSGFLASSLHGIGWHVTAGICQELAESRFLSLVWHRMPRLVCYVMAGKTIGTMRSCRYRGWHDEDPSVEVQPQCACCRSGPSRNSCDTIFAFEDMIILFIIVIGPSMADPVVRRHNLHLPVTTHVYAVIVCPSVSPFICYFQSLG